MGVEKVFFLIILILNLNVSVFVFVFFYVLLEKDGMFDDVVFFLMDDCIVLGLYFDEWWYLMEIDFVF